MAISSVRKTTGNASYVPTVSSKSAGQSFSQSFEQQMSEQQKQEYRERLETIFLEIRQDAHDMLQRRDMAQFEAYRQRISLLLGEILRHTYLFQSERIRDSRGREHVYATVQVVDDRMEQLGNDLLSENSEQLDMLSRMDEIRGLIMDLFS